MCGVVQMVMNKLREEEEEEEMEMYGDPEDMWEEWMGWEGAAGIRDYSSHINPYIWSHLDVHHHHNKTNYFLLVPIPCGDDDDVDLPSFNKDTADPLKTRRRID